MEKRLPVALRALARMGGFTRMSNGRWRSGLRRNTENKETRRHGEVLGYCDDCLHFSPRLRVSVLSVSNECNDLNADALAFATWRFGGDAKSMEKRLSVALKRQDAASPHLLHTFPTHLLLIIKK